jgi:hypothetical protein
VLVRLVGALLIYILELHSYKDIKRKDFMCFETLGTGYRMRKMLNEAVWPKERHSLYMIN